MRVPRIGLYFIVILFSDVMTVHFFFLVCDFPPLYLTTIEFSNIFIKLYKLYVHL